MNINRFVCQSTKDDEVVFCRCHRELLRLCEEMQTFIFDSEFEGEDATRAVDLLTRYKAAMEKS